MFVFVLGCSGENDLRWTTGRESEAIADGLRACAGETVEGVDVSDQQGRIDWGRVRAAGVRFAVIKATQGTYHRQQRFDQNWADARAAGLLRAAYHFFDPREDGRAQADAFLATMGQLEADDLPPVLDLECPDGNALCLGYGNGSGYARPDLIRQRALDFLAQVEARSGKRPMVYTFRSYLSSNGVSPEGFERYPLWIASLTNDGCYPIPSPWQKASIWQYDWYGRVPGIGGPVDRNRFLGNFDQLRAFASGSATRFESAGKWLAGFGRPDASALGDFDGNGQDDVAWFESWNDAAITVVRSQGAGFVGAERWATGLSAPAWTGAGDFDGDGRADLAWLQPTPNGTQDLFVLRSTGGSFDAPRLWLANLVAPKWAGVGDFDGDRRADLGWYDLHQDTLFVLRSGGDYFNPPEPWASAIGAPDWAGAGDFDGDGRTDIAWYENWNGSTVRVLRSMDGRFEGAEWLTGYGWPTWAAVADIDGDHRADLAWYEDWNEHSITVARSDGARLVDTGKWLRGWGAPDIAFLGRFDSDQRADIGWYEQWNQGALTVALAR